MPIKHTPAPVYGLSGMSLFMGVPRLCEAEKLATLTSDPFFQGLIFAGLGDRERAREALNRMATNPFTTAQLVKRSKEDWRSNPGARPYNRI